MTPGPRRFSRPLAHVSLRDQVVQPQSCSASPTRSKLPKVILDRLSIPLTHVERLFPYGNRLYEYAADGYAWNCWGAQNLYSSYYRDYKTFVARPERVALAEGARVGRAFIVQSDLKQFYDRVRPSILTNKMARFTESEQDDAYHDLASRALHWRWDSRDRWWAQEYSRVSRIPGFSDTALPQGLAASGFLANIVLLDFDAALKNSFDTYIYPGIRPLDYCRYVDDMRLVVDVDGALTTAEIEVAASEWLQVVLDDNAPGLQISREKTKAASFGDGDRPLVRRSFAMQRIQQSISGTFDPIAGEEILGRLQTLLAARDRDPAQQIANWNYPQLLMFLTMLVSRFAAARFRTTYRLLRPMLEDRFVGSAADGEGRTQLLVADKAPNEDVRTRNELDADSRAVALDLVEKWVANPSNVRLLLIAPQIFG